MTSYFLKYCLYTRRGLMLRAMLNTQQLANAYSAVLGPLAFTASTGKGTTDYLWRRYWSHDYENLKSDILFGPKIMTNRNRRTSTLIWYFSLWQRYRWPGTFCWALCCHKRRFGCCNTSQSINCYKTSFIYKFYGIWIGGTNMD